MKIIQITPGSGDNFYCENCLRDAVMVRGFRNLGHDALVVPLYLPLQMSEADIGSMSEIFMGGINVFLQQKSALFRHTPRWIDRLFDRPGLLRKLSRRAGSTSASDMADTTISMLRGEEGHQNKELDRLTTWLAQKERPDVVCLSNVLLAGMARRIRQALDVPVVCLLEDEDVFLDAMPESKRDEAWELLVQRAADIDMFIAVSHHFARVMQKRLRLKAERLRVVRPGIPKDDFIPADQPPSLPTIGYLSRMCRDKGLDVLVEAFIILKQNERLKDIRLCAAGGKTAYDDPYLDKIRSRLNSSGFIDSVEFLEKYHFADRYSFLRGLTVLSVPEKQAPAYGLYALESLAMGVPIVQPPSGVFPELQQEISDGITLTKSNDPEAFAAALEPLLLDPAAARERGLRGREKVLEKFNLNKTCSEMIEVFQLSAKLSQS